VVTAFGADPREHIALAQDANQATRPHDWQMPNPTPQHELSRERETFALGHGGDISLHYIHDFHHSIPSTGSKAKFVPSVKRQLRTTTAQILRLASSRR
jgi:hypothetical protein